MMYKKQITKEEYIKVLDICIDLARIINNKWEVVYEIGKPLNEGSGFAKEVFQSPIFFTEKNLG